MSKLARMQVKLIRVSVWGHVVRNDIHTGHFVFLFPLHPSILEPYLDLSFSQTKCVRDFDATTSSQVPIEVKFLFQFKRLVSRVRGPLSFSFPIRIYSTLKQTNSYVQTRISSTHHNNNALYIQRRMIHISCSILRTAKIQALLINCAHFSGKIIKHNKHN